jgi:hypothetical protein
MGGFRKFLAFLVLGTDLVNRWAVHYYQHPLVIWATLENLSVE